MDQENNSLENHPEWIPTEEQRAAGITETDLMRENPPPEETQTPEEFWPVDEYGLKIPMNEWGVSELGQFPDWAVDWLKRKLREKGLLAPVELLKELSPSQIAQDTASANAMLGEILREMGADQQPE